jgi:hypothetical protein
MSAGEKKVAALLAIVLVVMVGAYIVTGRSSAGPAGAGAVGQAGGMQGPGGGGFPEVTAMGPEDAKVKIVGMVPIMNPCHAATVAALKDVYEAHPDDIHLTLIDFMGPDSMEWKQKLGGVTCATVTINGKYTFDLEGRTVTFQKMEGGSYKPTDLKTVVEGELAKAG